MKPINVQKIAITCDDGSLDIMSFYLNGRGDTLPSGAVWDVQGNGTEWDREANLENIDFEIAQTYVNAPKKPVKFRLIEEKDIPTDFSNRKNWKDDGKKIK